MQNLLTIATLIGAAALPVVISWLIVVLPSRRREACGLVVGNPLLAAPLAHVQSLVSVPLVAMSRQLATGDMVEFVLGMRHLPVEKSAPLLVRFMRGEDPALQLYAQSLLAQGREKWQMRANKLAAAPEDDARCSAWLLEAGLTLASPALASAAERVGSLRELAAVARQRLAVCRPTPLLLMSAARVFLEAGLAEEARAALDRLPPESASRQPLEAAVSHALHLQRLT